jgi:hypothetical protein
MKIKQIAVGNDANNKVVIVAVGEDGNTYELDRSRYCAGEWKKIGD